MITVTTTEGVEEFPTATHLETEEVFNNLVVTDKKSLMVVFAQDYWVKVEQRGGQG